MINAVFESLDGETAVTAQQGEACTVRVTVHFTADVESPTFAITLVDESGHPAFSTNTDAQRIETGSFSAGADASIKVRFDNWLSPGRYTLIASVARAGFGADIFDAHMSNSIIVLADKPGGGVVDLPHTLVIDRL